VLQRAQEAFTRHGHHLAAAVPTDCGRWDDSWVGFFREQRLMHQLRLAGGWGAARCPAASPLGTQRMLNHLLHSRVVLISHSVSASLSPCPRPSAVWCAMPTLWGSLRSVECLPRREPDGWTRGREHSGWRRGGTVLHLLGIPAALCWSL
jgi:hypothetical protein